MKKVCLILSLLMCVNCSTIDGWFKRSKPVEEAKKEEPRKEEAPAPRVTRKSIEEESQLGEASGSLWSSRGQSAFLFTNNTQRLIGDSLPVNIEGYPKEQIQMKVNTIAKLVAQILNDKKQEIKLKDDEWQKENAPAPANPAAPAAEGAVQQRGLASAGGDKAPAMKPENEKAMREINDETEDIKQIQTSKDFIIRSVPTRVVEIQKDGNYRVKGEKAFMIGKREYKLNVSGVLRAEDFNDKGVSAEALMEASFDVNGDRKAEDL